MIGVLEKRKQPFGGGKNPNDNMAIFPLGTFHNLHPEDQADMWVSVKYDDPKKQSAGAGGDSRTAARPAQGRVEAADDFEISGRTRSELWGQLTGGLVLFMIALERGPDGGGRGSDEHHAGLGDGAHPRDRRAQSHRSDQAAILTQFTTEAVTLCAVGGIIGILWAPCSLDRVFLADRPAGQLSTGWVLTASGVSCVIGLVFGIYPAWKAANLDPIERCGTSRDQGSGARGQGSGNSTTLLCVRRRFVTVPAISFTKSR